MIGIVAPLRALDLARERNLDVVEISPQAVPPVCKLMDYGRFKYEQAKRENEARKKQKVAEIKEIRLHPHTDVHDIGVRVRKIKQFIAEGDKVKVSVQFRGREVFHPELGRQLLEDVVNQLKNVVIVERMPMMEGRNMWMMLSRAPGWDPKKDADMAALAETPPSGAIAQAFAEATAASTPAAPSVLGTPAPVAAAPPVSSTPAPAAAIPSVQTAPEPIAAAPSVPPVASTPAKPPLPSAPAPVASTPAVPPVPTVPAPAVMPTASTESASPTATTDAATPSAPVVVPAAPVAAPAPVVHKAKAATPKAVKPEAPVEAPPSANNPA